MSKYPLKLIKKIALSLAGSFILCLFLISCATDNKNNPTSPSTESQTISSIDSSKNIVHNNSLMKMAPCADGRNQVYTYYWQDQLQFCSTSGKYIGVMSDNNMSRIQYDIIQYGFTMICVSDPGSISQLKSYGYSLANIIIQLGSNGWQQIVDNAISQGVNRFYIDEPIRHTLQSLVQSSAPYIASKGGTLTISESEFGYVNWYIWHERGNIGAMVDLALSVSPSPFVCCHTHFDYQKWAGISVTIDPRDQWTYIMSRVPNLFKMVIIQTPQSSGDMGLLWGCANNMGIKQILLYPFQPDGTYAGVENAVYEGWMSNWVLQFQKQVIQWWCCAGLTYDDGCGFNKQNYTGLTRWILCN